MSDKNTKPTEFINEWLNKMKSGNPESHVVKGISEATKDGKLDEATLLKKLRELANPSEEKNQK